LSLELDDVCDRIFFFLLAYPAKYRFNQLHQAMNYHKFKISKPTLNTHLKHLVKKELLVRIQEGKQKVIYLINYDKFDNLKRTTENQYSHYTSFTEDMKEIEKENVSDLLARYYAIMMLNNISSLRAEILKILEPENLEDLLLSERFKHMYFKNYIEWFKKECIDRGEEWTKQALIKTNEMTDGIFDIFYKIEVDLKS